jgi:hypothetical protein
MVLVSSEIGTNTADPRIEPALNHVGIVNNGESGVYLGNYQWTGVQPGLERWGCGSVAGSTHGINQTRAFYTKFLDQKNNACAAAGDSGGGVFIRQADQWQLIGMLDALGGLRNQPAGTSILNGDINVIADLSEYHAQIDAILSPIRN